LHDHARGFVDGPDVGGLVKDLERDLLGFGGRGRRRRQVDDDALAGADGKVRPRVARADAHVAVGDQLLDLRSRMIAENRHEEWIESLAVGFGCDRELLLRTAHCLLPAAGCGMPAVHAATLRRRVMRCGVSGLVFDSQMSMAIASGPSSSEMNCDVDMPKTTPRGSPR